MKKKERTERESEQPKRRDHSSGAADLNVMRVSEKYRNVYRKIYDTFVRAHACYVSDLTVSFCLFRIRISVFFLLCRFVVVVVCFISVSGMRIYLNLTPIMTSRFSTLQTSHHHLTNRRQAIDC